MNSITNIREVYEIKDRGTVYEIDLATNKLPGKRVDIYRRLLNKRVLIDDRVRKVIGIELYATSDSYVHKRAGLLVKD
jgi:hypothetical protein